MGWKDTFPILKSSLPFGRGEMAARFGRFPFLDYQLLSLMKVGLKQINLVLKPEDTFFTGHYRFRGSLLFPEAEISLSFKKVTNGTVHAALCARDFVGYERFLLLNGYNNYPAGPLRMLLHSPGPHVSMVGFDMEGFNPWVKQRLRSFAVIRSEGGTLKQIYAGSICSGTTIWGIRNRLGVTCTIWFTQH